MEWLFDLCCEIMSGIGHLLGFTYKEICVIGNIHVQGGIWLLSALIPIITMMLRKQTSLTWKLFWAFAIILGIIHAILFAVLCERYSFPVTEGFDICVNDLHYIAKNYNTTYQAVNIYIFVIGWLLSIVWNIMTSKLILNNKTALSFVAMIISTLSLLTFMFSVVGFVFK